MASEGLSNSVVAAGGQLTGSAGTATLLHASKHTTQSASAPETEQATPSREIWFQKHLKIKVSVKSFDFGDTTALFLHPFAISDDHFIILPR